MKNHSVKWDAFVEKEEPFLLCLDNSTAFSTEETFSIENFLKPLDTININTELFMRTESKETISNLFERKKKWFRFNKN